MTEMTWRPIALALLWMASSLGSASAGPELQWMRYVNARFGVSAEYPAAMFRSPVESDNGDGVRFDRNTEGVTLAIWGGSNALDQTPYQAICMDGCRGETYRLDRANIGISSGLREGEIYYKKCVLKRARAGDAFHCFEMTYPSARKGQFDPIAARIGRSLR